MLRDNDRYQATSFCRSQKVSASSERSWDAYQAERYRRGERDTHPGYTENPFRTARQQVNA